MEKYRVKIKYSQKHKKEKLFFWYIEGEEYEVIPYRHNPKDYWELSKFGNGKLYGDSFWIMKEDSTVIPDMDWLDEILDA